MPSYRYTRDIDPDDLKQAPQQEYNRRQRGGNWWHYHWKLVLIILAAVALVVFFVYEMVSSVKPDTVVGVISPYTLPESVTVALAEQLAPLVGDVNGDGEQTVLVEVYTIDASEFGQDEEALAQATSGADASANLAASDADLSDIMGGDGATDPYAQMAGVTKLMAAFEGSECIILMADAEQAQAYQDTYQMFGLPDGALAPEGTDVTELTVAFSELAGLDMDALDFTDYDGTVFSGGELLANCRVGLRALTGTKLESEGDGAANWQMGKDVLEALLGRQWGA